MRTRRTHLLTLLALLAAAAGPAAAQSGHAEAGHAEQALVSSEQATLSGLLEDAVQRHPAAGLAAAQRETAAAEQSYGRHWFPEAAELGGYYWDDRTYDDTGVYEAEAMLSLPMWLPGEKRARTALGDALDTAQQSYQAEFRWRVAGQLRREAWQLTAAQRRWELAAEQEQRLEGVLEQVTLFTEVGDTARSDLLSTVQELALWRADTLALEAEYQDAVRSFSALTGGHVIPARLEEPLSERSAIGDDHPALRAALDRTSAARANAGAVSEGNSSRPRVNLFWRDFRGDRASPEINALGIGFSVPLGKSASHRPEIARAHEEFAATEAELLRTRRELELQLHEARHQLHTVDSQLDNARTAVDAAAERHRLDQLAFELGEISVRQWLRRLSETREIETAYELLLIERGAAIAAYNQAVGELP